MDSRATLVWYYLATPLFALVDLGLGYPIRVAGLDDPLHRAGYYLVLMGLAVLVHHRGGLAPWVGMGESVVNLFLLLLSILLPIWSLPEQVLAGDEVGGGLDVSGAVNALVSGSALIVSFHRYQAAASGRWTGGKHG